MWCGCFTKVTLFCRFKRILVLISHSQDFLNGVCTNIINLHQRNLKYYTVKEPTSLPCLMNWVPQTNFVNHPPFLLKGNYDQYVKTREELEENQMKRFNWEQDQIAHMKVRFYIRFENIYFLRLTLYQCAFPIFSPTWIIWSHNICLLIFRTTLLGLVMALPS